MAGHDPAIHLGAEKVLIIGAGRMNEQTPRQRTSRYPTLAQIAGHAMSSIFLDSLAVDIERLTRINKTLSMLPSDLLQKTPLKPVDLLIKETLLPVDRRVQVKIQDKSRKFPR